MQRYRTDSDPSCSDAEIRMMPATVTSHHRHTNGVLLLSLLWSATTLRVSHAVPTLPAASAIAIAPFLPNEEGFFHPTGRIPEAHCNVEELEIANDSQLYSILQELKQTSFFRNFLVDLDQKCPLSRNFGKANSHSHTKDQQPQQEAKSETPAIGVATHSSDNDSHNKEDDDDGSTCASEGLPDLDPEAEPACHVQMNDPFGSSAMSGSMTPPTSSNHHGKDTGTATSQTQNTDSVTTVTAAATATADAAAATTTEDPNVDDDFDCTGGKDLDMDDDDEPLCTLNQGSDYTQPIRSFISMALASIRSLGWESESQRKTYQWTKETNPVVTDYECDENGQLPDIFWQDMCSSISNEDSSKAINLVLNPERNTGYNGTHIWNAIYQENCLANSDLCYEERVLYRLLSGLHTSTTLSIAKHYYPPSKRKNRTHWEPNPALFMDKFQNHPEHLRNMHFSYVVLLRALKKASTFLHHFEIMSGNMVEDEVTARLLRRLLDSDILESCQSVFTAFDERLMFAGTESLALQQNFKGVFHNISSIFDCVQCQQCKLHGKMAMLGYGTALKILFMKNSESYSLTRNEVVAFINTLAKFSESLRDVRELTNLYWKETAIQIPQVPANELDLVDIAVGLIATLARQGKIDETWEAQLVELAMKRDDKLLLLVKHYSTDMDKFVNLAATVIGEPQIVDERPDAIVVGSGLAGLAAALNLLDRGGTVTIVDKEHSLGGNSNKASSGINACCPSNDKGNWGLSGSLPQ